MRSSIIGTVIGAIPATGGNIAAYIAYDQTKKWSKAQMGSTPIKDIPTPKSPAIIPFIKDFPDTAMMTDKPKNARAQYSGEPNSIQMLANRGAARIRTIQLKNVPMPEANGSL